VPDAKLFPRFDVLIAGGGNAALCAALSAAAEGATVAVLECAPPEFRGGNSRHTRNLRCMHEAPTQFLTGAYPEEEYFDDLIRVTGGNTNRELACMVIRESRDCVAWMMQQGVRFQKPLTGTLHLGRTNAFFLGGGKALMNSYYATARRMGVQIFYGAEVTGLNFAGAEFESADVLLNGDAIQFRAGALVAAAGGFESNLEWLKEIWGEAADNFLIRGTPYNRGNVLKLLLAKGAASAGDAAQFHAVAIDARAPKFDGGIVTRLDCLPLGIVINQTGDRFYDEGEDLWPKRYAIWGRLIAQQPGQIAWSIIDAKAVGKFMPSVFPSVRGNTIRELATALGLNADAVEATVERFNAAVIPGQFDFLKLDDCRTRGLAIEKRHWAQTIDAPPFLGYPLRPGITFTYLGVKVDRNAAVLSDGGRLARNVFAAGEIMAGNILGRGYVGGIGMAIGTVFGRIAGQEAARVAK
jgi:tricarballylate dehydrogenase